MTRNIPDVNENAAQGIYWNTEDVAKGTGADKVVVCTYAQIPSIVDLDKFRNAFGDEPLLGWANGQSLRVNAQAICRRMAKDNPVEQRAAIMNYIRGVRNASTQRVVEKLVFIIPNAADITEVSPVEVNSEVELAAALMDADWHPEQAMKMANKMWLARTGTK